MIDITRRTAPTFTSSPSRAHAIISAAVMIILPLLMLFPTLAGWFAGILTLLGLGSLIHRRDICSMDGHFAAICLILPVAQLWNMAVMGWAPGVLFRPTHLLWGLMIYFLIGHYGFRRNSLFYGACLASVTALGIAIFEAIYLGNERVFGFGNRWNAVPFGNFSMLFAFFCLCGGFVSSEKEKLMKLLLGLGGFACGFTASLLSGTRGGWLAIPFLVALCFFFNDRLSRRSKGMALLVIAIVILAMFAGSQRVRDRIDVTREQVTSYFAHPASKAVQETSTGLRLSMWRWGWEKFKEHPYTGVGLSNYKEEKEKAVKTGQVPAAFDGFANLHNELITALALGGLPSALALLVFWILSWKFFSSKLKSLDDDQHYFALCGLVAVLGTALFSMTEGLFGTSPGTKAIMLAIALPAGALRYVMREGRTTAHAESIRRL